MNINDLNNIQPDSTIEQPQRFVELPPDAEVYNPDEDPGDMPYIPTMSQATQYQRPQIPMKPLTEGFVDMNNLDKYKAKPDADATNKIKQTVQNALNINKAPNYDAAPAKRNEFNDVLSKLGNLADVVCSDAPNQGRPSNAPAPLNVTKPDQSKAPIDSTLTHMKNTLTSLRNVNAWIPESKKEYAPKLTNIATPIIKALDAYISILEKMK